MSDTPAHTSAFKPLRLPVFRNLWIATVVSYIGSAMQDAAAPWLMTQLMHGAANSKFMVALVQTAGSVAVCLLALPAGALADIVDRRRLLLIAQVWMTAVAGILAVLAWHGWITPWVLIGLVFAMAIGGALNAPAWSAIMPELVEWSELPSAIALNSIAFNIARAVGPATGGLIVGAFGAHGSFLLNALSFLGVIAVLYAWRRKHLVSTLPAERLWGAMRAGVRYAWYAPALKAVLIRTGVFIVFASAFWGLYPSIATQQIGLSAEGFGILVGFMGAGALTAASVLPRLRSRFSTDGMISLGTLLFAAATLGLAYSTRMRFGCPAMFVAGVAWMITMSTLSVACQSAVPGWVRARALSVHLAIFFLALAAGSALWGYLADRHGMPASLTWAVGGMFATLLITRWVRLSDSSGEDLRPARHWPAPPGADDLRPDRGPVLVTVTYRIDPARRLEFAQAMEPIRLMRLRDGAIRWGLWSDAADPARVVESFVVDSWLEHRRQHERVTLADRATQDRARSYHVAPEPPAVSHFVAEF